MSSTVEPKKRDIAFYFSHSQPAKRPRTSPPTKDVTSSSSVEGNEAGAQDPPTIHLTYPHPIVSLSPAIISAINFAPEAEGYVINNRPDLDLVYFKPYIPSSIQEQIFKFLRAKLPFYRVKYSIKRGSVETVVNTPRYTTVFGVDETSSFSTKFPFTLVDSLTRKPVPANAYRAMPRPIPGCLETLRRSTEAVTGQTFNFCLVNYYATGDDSISYHSDDERFLGDNPSIASFSLGEKRDFLLRHKDKERYANPKERDLKLELGSGDMVLMKGKTQSKWLHSIPKRKGASGEKGRINITFRKALVKAGTENYYKYNVGEGEVYRWSETSKEMRIWQGSN